MDQSLFLLPHFATFFCLDLSGLVTEVGNSGSELTDLC